MNCTLISRQENETDVLQAAATLVFMSRKSWAEFTNGSEQQSPDVSENKMEPAKVTAKQSKRKNSSMKQNKSKGATNKAIVAKKALEKENITKKVAPKKIVTKENAANATDAVRTSERLMIKRVKKLANFLALNQKSVKSTDSLAVKKKPLKANNKMVKKIKKSDPGSLEAKFIREIAQPFSSIPTRPLGMGY